MISLRAALQRHCLRSEGGDGEAKHSKLMLGGSSLRPGPLGFLLAGPAVIFLMISLFCRKSLSPGETRHFRHGETRRWARLTLGPATSAATSQGTNTSFHPACVSLLSFSLYPHNHQYNPFFSSSHLSSGGLASLLSSNSFLLTYK